MKAGWRTTEFWLSMVAAVVGVLATSGVLAPESNAAKLVGLAMVVLSAMGYSVARGVAKSAPPAKK